MKRYFISYVMFKENEQGFGNVVIEIKKEMDIETLIKIKNDLIKANKYDDLMIMNYILMKGDNNEKNS